MLDQTKKYSGTLPVSGCSTHKFFSTLHNTFYVIGGWVLVKVLCGTISGREYTICVWYNYYYIFIVLAYLITVECMPWHWNIYSHITHNIHNSMIGIRLTTHQYLLSTLQYICSGWHTLYQVSHSGRCHPLHFFCGSYVSPSDLWFCRSPTPYQ